MSYQDFGRNGTGASASTMLSQSSRSVEGMLLKLANNVSSLKKVVDLLGSARDTVDHRHRISDTNRTIQDLAQQVKSSLTQGHNLAPATSPEQQQRHKKLLQDFATILQDYKATQKLAQEREAAHIPKPNPVRAGRDSGAAAAAALQQQGNGQQLEAEMEKQALLQEQRAREEAALEAAMAHNEALIEERDAGIREIAQQIGEVNEMFQDLAVLINDQGVQIRTIDEQITMTAERTKEGTRQLVQAERSQRSQRNKCLWLWLIAALVVSLVIIIIFS